MAHLYATAHCLEISAIESQQQPVGGKDPYSSAADRQPS